VKFLYPVGISWTCLMLIKLEWLVKKLWQYDKPFSSNPGMSRTDRRTEGRTDRIATVYQYRASALTCDKNRNWRVCTQQNWSGLRQNLGTQIKLWSLFGLSKRLIQTVKWLAVLWTPHALYIMCTNQRAILAHQIQSNTVVNLQYRLWLEHIPN